MRFWRPPCYPSPAPRSQPSPPPPRRSCRRPGSPSEAVAPWRASTIGETSSGSGRSIPGIVAVRPVSITSTVLGTVAAAPAHRSHVAQRLALLQLADPLRQLRMVGRDGDEGRLGERLRLGGEDDGPRAGRRRRVELDALDAAQQRALRAERVLVPALERVEVVVVLRRIPRGAEEPLLERHEADLAFAAPADAALGLRLREHRLAGVAPVDVALLAVDQVVLVEQQEEVLGPLIVLLLARDERALPVERGAERGEVAAEVLAALRDPLGRRDAAADRLQLRGQPEGVEAGREQDLVAHRATEARERVRDGVDARVPEVRVAGRERARREDVASGAGGICILLAGRRERTRVAPGRLPALVEQRGDVAAGVHVAIVSRRHVLPQLTRFRKSLCSTPDGTRTRISGLKGRYSPGNLRSGTPAIALPEGDRTPEIGQAHPGLMSGTRQCLLSPACSL